MPPATTDDDYEENTISARTRHEILEERERERQEERERGERDDDDDDDDDRADANNINISRRQREREEDTEDITEGSRTTRRARFGRTQGDDSSSVTHVPTPPTPTTTAAVVPQPMPTNNTNKMGILNTLTRMYPAGYGNDAMREEMEVQRNVKGEPQAIANFRTEMLQQQQLTVFAFVQPKDSTIHLLHSPATYYARGATGPLKGKDIGFVGDRSEYNTPAPVVLQPEKPWKWMTKQAVKDAAFFETFYANPANNGKLFTPPPGTALTRIVAPRLLLLPGNLVQYCVGGTRTPWDLHKHVTTLVSAPGSGLFSSQHYELVLDWCCLALLSEGADSALQYDLQAAASNEVVHRWARMRIDATLGPTTSPQQPTQQTAPAQDLTHLSTIAAEFGKGVINALRPPNATATIATTLGATQSGDGKDYDKYQKALLRGFSHSPTLAGLQPIWELFTHTKNIDIHRMHLREAMTTWAAKWGVTITSGIHLPKLAIEDIVNL